MAYLGDNAKRAHPKRDARTGRTVLDLKPDFEVSDRKAVRGKTSQPMAAEVPTYEDQHNRDSRLKEKERDKRKGSSLFLFSPRLRHLNRSS